jgi:PAS domain S-box-containing protein
MANSTDMTIRVLHVDDDSSFLHISKLMLKTLNDGLIIDGVSSVDEAFRKFSENQYDVIVSDFDMPTKNGLDFLKELKEKKVDIPFILFTGKGREEIAIEALNLGAAGYINKQGLPETVYGELVHCIKNTYKLMEAKIELQLSEEKYSALYKNSPDAITITGLKDGKIIEVNNSALHFFGFSESEIIGKTTIELDTWESATERNRFIALILQNGSIKNVEFRLRKKDKSIVIASMSASIITINNETCIHSTFRDVTEQTKDKALVQESETKFRKTFETTPDAIYLINQKDGTIIEVNDRLTELFGYSKEELIGKKTIDFNIWANLHEMEEVKRDLYTNGVVRNREVLWRKKDGTLFPSLLSVSLVQLNTEAFTVGIIKDITEIKKTEEELIKRQTTLDALLSSANSPMFMVDTKYCYLTFNSVHATVMKTLYGADIKVGKNLLDYMTNSVDREIAKRNIDKALSGEFLEDGKETGDPKLQRSHYLVRHYPVKKDGEVVAVSIIAMQIPKDKTNTFEIEKQTIASNTAEQEFSKLLSTMKEGVCIHQVIYNTKGQAINYRILSANNAFENMTGIKEESARGKLATELYGTPEAPYLDIYSKVAETGVTTSFDTFFPPLSKYFQISVFSPKKNQFATVFQDITEQKQIQNALKKSEAQYRLLAEKTTDVIWTMNLDGHFTYVSPSVEKLGYTPQEVMNQTIAEALTPQSAKIALDALQRFSATGVIPNGFFELEQICKDGSTVWTEVNISIIQSNQGEPPTILGVSRNITERKKNEEKLHRSELILENSSDSIITTDLLGKITSWNKGAEEIFGYTASEMIGQHITKIVKAEEKNQVAPKQLDEIRKGKNFAKRWEGLRKDGSAVWLLLTTKIIKNDKNQPVGMVGFGKDVTDYKKVQDELELSSSLINLVNDSIHVLDMKGNLLYFNEATYKNRGYSLEEMSAMKIHDLDAPESAALIESRMEQLAKMGYAVFESVDLCKDGTRVPVEVHARIIGEGDNQLILSIVRDIGERKTAELELRKSKEQTELVKEKLRVLGSLTRHDVGNKLSIAKSNLFLLKKVLKGNPQTSVVEYINAVERALTESDKIFEFSKFYEKIGAEQPTIIDIGKQFDEAIKLRAQSNIRIINQVHGKSVLADSMLKHLFYNLLDNSIKHGKTVDKIKLFTEQFENQLIITYEDNGVGIPLENKTKIFSEGFTTGGTGLGLKLVKRMVEVYGWTITEEGEPGKGAKFVITIPNAKIH